MAKLTYERVGILTLSEPQIGALERLLSAVSDAPEVHAACNKELEDCGRAHLDVSDWTLLAEIFNVL